MHYTLTINRQMKYYYKLFGVHDCKLAQNSIKIKNDKRIFLILWLHEYMYEKQI